MKVIRIQAHDEIKHTYPCSTESPTPFWSNGLPLCRAWFADNLGRYVEGFHLKAEDCRTIGHVYWASSNNALAPYDIEDGVAYIYCEWVQRKHQGKGGMHLLFQKFMDFLNTQGYKGILVVGTEYEGYLHYSHYLKRGFQMIGQEKEGKLLYYPLSQASIVVNPVRRRFPHKDNSEVEILVIGSHFCPVGASAALAVKKVANELGEQVNIQQVPASRETIAQYGVADGIFINGKAKFFGPVKESQVRKAIVEELDQKI